jgi:hypothetical protein
MNTSHTRRFTLLDALALLAATGVGLVPSRPFLADLVATSRTLETEFLGDTYYWKTVLLKTPRSFLWPSVLSLSTNSVSAALQVGPPDIGLTSPPGQAVDIAQDVSVLAFPLLCSWSFVVLRLRLVAPRPRWRVLAAQPGLWACGAAVGSIFVASWLEALFVGIPAVAIPTSVGLSWLVLGISRRWAGERSWLDRLGRLIGILWIGLALPMGVWHAWCWAA